MTSTLLSKNSFLKGMNQDNIESLSNSESYFYALNGLNGNTRNRNFGLSNEGSNSLFSNVGSKVIGTSYNEERNITIFFNEDDSISLFDHKTGDIKPIVKSSEFGCTWGFSDCEWIGSNVQFKTMDPCNELYIYFSSGCEYYKVNIDLMLNPDRKEGLIKELNCETKCGLNDNCEYFKVFKMSCSPKITPKSFSNGGGNLPAGAYTFVTRMLHIDGGETNWSHFSPTVYVGSEHNKAGELSNSHVEVSMSCLDCKFGKMELAVIENIGGIITAKSLGNINYTNNNYSYKYYGQEGLPININELLVKGNTYLQGKHLEQKDGHMLYYGIKSRKNVNYQKYANSILTEFVVWDLPYDSVKKYNIKSHIRGGVYSYSLILNYIDGSHSKGFHIPCLPFTGGLAGGTVQTVDEDDTSTVTLSKSQELNRTRLPIEDSVSNPQNDHFDVIIQKLLDDLDTNAVEDICAEILLDKQSKKAQCCECVGNVECTEEGAAYQQCMEDMDDVDDSIASLSDMLESYGLDKLDPEYTSTNIKEGAISILNSIKKRERVTRSRLEYNINKNIQYTEQTLTDDIKGISGGKGDSTFSGPLFDCCGINETEVEIVETSVGRTKPSYETNIKYPCTTDCEGNFIFGDLAGTPVCNHQYPYASEEPHFISKSEGVPYGTFWNDSSETNDLYIRIMGPRFSNIELPSEDELPLPLCPNNPYTIGVVKRTDSNKKVILKGLANGTFRITNNNKDHDQVRYGVNSMEEVSFYHDDGNGGRLSNQGSGESHMLYSLDGITLKPALHATKYNNELNFRGKGERYAQHIKGKVPEDSWNGSRIDALGTTQSINLNTYSLGQGEGEIVFKKYAEANDVTTPGAGGTVPLMNNSQQEGIFFKSNLAQLVDHSFTGDVLNRNVPIDYAEGQYVSLIRELDDQYGNLENLNYYPLLQAGKKYTDSIQGLVGDTYIGTFSFVKTAFVSDKVGSCTEEGKFNIPAQVDTKTEKRCICDGPEDIINQANGNWIWTELPEDGDAADPKNWAGTHTHNLEHTDTYNESVGQPAVSDMYYPGTLTSMTSFVGEFETCPWLREKSEELRNQWYPEIKTPDFRFVSGPSIDGDNLGWEDSFMNQYHRRMEQPSLRKRVFKTFIRTSLNILFPILGINNLFDMDSGGLELVTNLAEFPILVALWYLMVQVLFTNDKLDKLLGIPVCKSDDTGGIGENFNRGLFYNYNRYNLDYSTVSDIYTYEGMPDNYYVCDCDDCVDGELSNEVYISDRQVQGSMFDSYTHVKPLSKIHIPSNFGNLNNIFTVGGNLYAHTSDAFIALRHRRTLINSEEGAIVLGSSGFLNEPEGYTEGVIEGFAGLSNHNYQINTQYGYFFIDTEANIVYRFSSKGLEPISSKGMFNFFKNKLEFCEESECEGENIVGNNFYTMGVDPRFNRFLLTKNSINSNESFTISYDIDNGNWISFHSYIPLSYIWDRKDMLTLSQTGDIWKHHDGNSFQTFYGDFKPFEVEFTAIPKDLESFKWSNMMINSEAEEDINSHIIKGIDRTFNKIAMYNSSQGTGTLKVEWIGDNKDDFEDAMDIITDKFNIIRAHKRDGFWDINEFKDYRIDDCKDQPMTILNKCEAISKINESIFDEDVVNVQNFSNKKISDKYLTYRLIYDYDNKTNLNIIYVNTYGDGSKIQ